MGAGAAAALLVRCPPRPWPLASHHRAELRPPPPLPDHRPRHRVTRTVSHAQCQPQSDQFEEQLTRVRFLTQLLELEPLLDIPDCGAVLEAPAGMINAPAGMQQASSKVKERAPPGTRLINLIMCLAPQILAENVPARSNMASIV